MDKSIASPVFALLAGAVSAAALAAPAAAQPYSKAEAILGAPSALEALVAQQSGQPLPPRPTIRPASLSYSRPQVVAAVLRERPAVSPGVLNGRPDIFGSVALRIGRTPLDARWRRVEHSGVGATAGAYAASLRGKDAFERLQAVNWYVNKRVRFTDDDRRSGRGDVWSPAAETLSRGRGDCEDYAIAKLQMLRRAGFADRDLYLVVVKDLVRRADHAVLVARANGHMYVLDNGTDELLDTEAVRDYRPVITFAAAGSSWTHGYRVRRAPINIASARDSALSPAADTAAEPAAETGASGDQRSRNASLRAWSTGFNK